MERPDGPEEYYREASRQSGRDDLDAVLGSTMQGRIHLAMYLGLWDGKGSLPSRFEEETLHAVDPRLQGLVRCAEEHLRDQGFDYFEPWLPLLRFLRSVVMDRAFSDIRGGHPYSKDLRRRYRGYLEDILRAAIPDLPRKEGRVPPKLFEEFLDIYARLLEIRRRFRARRPRTFSETDLRSLFPDLPEESVRAKLVEIQRWVSGRGRKTFPEADFRLLFPDLPKEYNSAKLLEIRQEVSARRRGMFPEADLRLLFSDLPEEVIKTISEDDQISHNKHGRGLGQRKIAVRILAYRYQASESTIRTWLGEARIRDQVAVSWGHAEPLKQRLMCRARIYRPQE